MSPRLTSTSGRSRPRPASAFAAIWPRSNEPPALQRPIAFRAARTNGFRRIATPGPLPFELLTALVGISSRRSARSAGAIARAQQLLRLDPVDEGSWCALMRCHARRGDRATALHIYQQCAALLKKELGIQPGAATRLTYREILDLDAAAAVIPTPPRTAVYPLVGRRTEWHTLLHAWHAAESWPSAVRVDSRRGGHRQDAAGGRTGRLVRSPERQRAVRPLLCRRRTSGVRADRRLAEGRRAAARAGAARRIVADRHREASPEVIEARSDVPAPGQQLESWQRLRFFEALVQAFRGAAPVVLVVDDLQWADADTLEWLQYFLRSASDTPLLVVGTVRAGEEQDNKPLGRLLGQLERAETLTVMPLGPLDRAATSELAGAVAEHPLDEAALATAFRETEGHPLFIVERGRMELAGIAGRYDPGRAVAGAVGRCGAAGAAVRGGARGRRGRGGGGARFPVRHPRRGERPRGAGAGSRARRALAPPYRPRPGRGAVGLHPRPDPRGGLQRDRAGPRPPHPPAHRARDGAAVRESPRRRERLDRAHTWFAAASRPGRFRSSNALPRSPHASRPARKRFAA